MPEMTWHPAGTVSWVELATPDIPAARAFYGALFGWSGYRLALDSHADYEIFTLGDVQGPEIGGMDGFSDAPVASWSTYVRSDDLDETTRRVKRLGGAEALPPADIAHLGRFAICVDSQGADFLLWLPYDFKGAAVIREPSALCWVELVCPDPAKARAFYEGVFGWTVAELPDGRTVFRNDGQPVAELTGGGAPTWRPYFQVTDCDATADLALELGAVLLEPPAGTPLGRRCLITDPAGATFAILDPATGA
jgi:hypothetical protein